MFDEHDITNCDPKKSNPPTKETKFGNYLENLLENIWRIGIYDIYLHNKNDIGTDSNKQQQRQMSDFRRLFITINILTMDTFASFFKEDVAKKMGVHRNTVKLKDGKGVIGDYLALETEVVYKNKNLVRKNAFKKKGNEVQD